ncbi:hypothetical protein WN51_13744 [Melipona quadrifasciata]|uniref:Uncharacterized protein n=1 Tax=Melipona quadrifasciata TaxID=166423 RepID=A0A0M9A060_9HYME|nr:hypothetical protein WN51_13744 [Melipona quadrifasciata]
MAVHTPLFPSPSVSLSFAGKGVKLYRLKIRQTVLWQQSPPADEIHPYHDFTWQGEKDNVHCVHTDIAYSTDVLSRAAILFEFYVGISVEWFMPALILNATVYPYVSQTVSPGLTSKPLRVRRGLDNRDEYSLNLDRVGAKRIHVEKHNDREETKEKRRMGRARRRNDMPVVRFPADISGDRAAAAASATDSRVRLEEAEREKSVARYITHKVTRWQCLLNLKKTLLASTPNILDKLHLQQSDTPLYLVGACIDIGGGFTGPRAGPDSPLLFMSPGALGPPTPIAVPFTIGVLPDICPCVTKSSFPDSDCGSIRREEPGNVELATLQFGAGSAGEGVDGTTQPGNNTTKSGLPSAAAWNAGASGGRGRATDRAQVRFRDEKVERRAAEAAGKATRVSLYS